MDRPAIISSALFAAFCNDCGVLPDQPDPFNPFPNGIPPGIGREQYAKLACVTSLFKKSEVESSPTAEAETFSKFLAANLACGSIQRDHFDLSEDSPSVGYAITTARHLLYQWFTPMVGDITQSSIEMAARFGPGASVGLRGAPTSMYFKVGDAPLTASSQFVRSWYEQSVSYLPLCEAAEMARKARHGDIQLESCGNLSFVPKSYASKRIVVTEPSLNTYFQLGLGAEMERVLRTNTEIDFATQPGLNAELARLGSISGEFATMDLSQCSDYISLELCRFMFPKGLFDWMTILRTGTVKVPKDFGGFEMPLDMMSTMGNGFTFPMQTVLLSALVLGVYATMGLKTHDFENVRSWGVFGDDIIVHTVAFNLLSRVLARLGLVVNAAKSYSSGPFRESCGSDYFEGHNVRGVYLKKYVTDQDLFSCFNRLAIWGAEHGLELTTTLAVILSFISGTCNIVPPDCSMDSGIIAPNPPVEDLDGNWVFYAYVPDRNSFSFEPWDLFSVGFYPDSAQKKRRFARWLSDLRRYCDGSINEPAALKVLLAGGLRRGKISMRMQKVSYRLIKQVTPRWGFSATDKVPMIGTDLFNRWDRNVRLALAMLQESVA